MATNAKPYDSLNWKPPLLTLSVKHLNGPSSGAQTVSMKSLKPFPLLAPSKSSEISWEIKP
jgi:hypothetical protein